MQRARMLVLLASLGSACSRDVRPCYGETCPTGTECLANRCVPPAATPVADDTERWLLTPRVAAVVSESEPREASLPPAVVFGSARYGDVALYLRFPSEWKARGTIANAFLLLEPATGTAADEQDVEVEVSVVRKAWDPASVTFRHRPELGRSRRAGLARSGPPTALRVDVTELVREISKKRGDHGLAVTARSTDGHGAAFLTGGAGGPPPRLEVYLRRPRTP